ncbi:MAG: hypothetical protein RI988_2295, partial [Pseudomonadota bacterium]
MYEAVFPTLTSHSLADQPAKPRPDQRAAGEEPAEDEFMKHIIAVLLE